jgi:hypothetical protein
MDALEQATRTRLLSLVRLTPREIEVATSMLRDHIASLQAELAELNVVGQRAEALGLLASWLVRWAVARRERRLVRELNALRSQVMRDERAGNQLEQWLDTRVQLVCAEYRRAKGRVDYVARVEAARPNDVTSVPAARGLALAGVNQAAAY